MPFRSVRSTSRSAAPRNPAGSAASRNPRNPAGSGGPPKAGSRKSASRRNSPQKSAVCKNSLAAAPPAGQAQNLSDSRPDGVYVFGARSHNLKNINVFIPRNKITVVTGLSGSGKSSLAFDTVYAESRRRYLESFSVYARHFIDQLEKPDVEDIFGLSPSISIDQKTISYNPRSTVGTVTEMYDFLRLLYAKTGEAFCPEHRLPLQGQSQDKIEREIMSEKRSLWILSPVIRNGRGEFQKELRYLRSVGFDRVRIDGEWKDLHRIYRLTATSRHSLDLLVDRLSPESEKHEKRVCEAIERALSMSGGYIKVMDPKTGRETMHSLHYACPVCGHAACRPSPSLFSFNSPIGACRRCHGTGLSFFVEEETDETPEPCPACLGARLSKEALQVQIQGKNIAEAGDLDALRLEEFLRSLSFQKSKKLIADQITEPLLTSLDFLQTLGAGYLSLNRAVSTLSGGEAQRVRLISQLSSPLIGVLYVLDEPSIGLHPRDHGKILSVLRKIRDRGNTVVMVEHDEAGIRSADKVIDLGPGAGAAGGFVTAEGTVRQIEKNPDSLTGLWLSRKRSIPQVKSLYSGKNPKLKLRGASLYNLKNIDVSIPLGCLVGVSGVSGSGKSSLVRGTLFPALQRQEGASRAVKKRAARKPLFPFLKAADGLDLIDRAIQIDQKPIGRTPRSVPATYTGLFNMIRLLFSELPESRMRGRSPGDFSFNVTGGRCETCQGGGSCKLEMGFLPNAFTVCNDCQGRRYREDILNIRYKGKNIYDVLNMTAGEAFEFFKNHSFIRGRLSFLKETGLEYIKLGQSSVTLSGGEAQRIKLSRELAKTVKGHILYILDEPTTGLHFEDVRKLIELLRKLALKGRTVLVIEHNTEVLKSCDYLIDLGPDGGERGGEVVFEGPPALAAKASSSQTGRFLKPYF